MLLRMASLSPSFTVTKTRASPFFNFFLRTPLLFPRVNTTHLKHHHFIKRIHANRVCPNPFSMNKSENLCTATAVLQDSSSSASLSNPVSNKAKKKARRESPEGVLKHRLDQCSKRGDLAEAVRLYEEARHLVHRQTNLEGALVQEWLQRHGPFDAVIDGANVGLVNQHNFNFSQLKSIVNEFRQRSPLKRLPLVILHKNRVTGGPAQHPNNKNLLESWKKAGALYATPQGSNDDWYWLYAAVSCNCLLVTNDEMRDHLFQLLGTSFFPRWKEKHQVRLSFSRQGLSIHMPPPYSIVIQESEQGSWHVPTVTGDDLETPRQWLCATRSRKLRSLFS